MHSGRGNLRTRAGFILIIGLAALLAAPEAGYAYIGPGAGFAFMTSFLILFATFFLAFFFFLTWPIRFLIKRLRRRGKAVEGRVDKVIVLGFDGLDPGLLQQYLKKGILPNIAQLIESGSFRFYDAPVVIMLSMHKNLPRSRYMDIGMCVQNLMLSAHARGLGTCAIALTLLYGDVIRTALKIDPELETVLCVSLGYPDETFIMNKFRSSREDLDGFVTWCER